MYPVCMAMLYPLGPRYFGVMDFVSFCMNGAIFEVLLMFVVRVMYLDYLKCGSQETNVVLRVKNICSSQGQGQIRSGKKQGIKSQKRKEEAVGTTWNDWTQQQC